jgi:prepilin-type N-terminal cleavage/methylation domain-containing protein
MNERNSQHGFTLVEVLIVVAVLALLAGVVVPMFGTVSRDAKLSRILQTYEQLRDATQRHYSDTSFLAVEYSGSTGATNHRLSMNPGTNGWKGPYIDHPLNTSDNPFGNPVYVFDGLTNINSLGPGFDLDGDGTVEAVNAGQMVAFYGVPSADAAEINNKLDNGVAGAWETTGRVKYVGGNLLILLMDAPN